MHWAKFVACLLACWFVCVSVDCAPLTRSLSHCRCGVKKKCHWDTFCFTLTHPSRCVRITADPLITQNSLCVIFKILKKVWVQPHTHTNTHEPSSERASKRTMSIATIRYSCFFLLFFCCFVFALGCRIHSWLYIIIIQKQSFLCIH